MQFKGGLISKKGCFLSLLANSFWQQYICAGRAFLLSAFKNKGVNMALKPGPKRIADSTGKPDQRQRDNKSTPGNTPALKPSKSSTPKKK